MVCPPAVQTGPKFEKILCRWHARCVNERLRSLKCDEVRDGDEARIASAVFKEQDGILAAGLLPVGTAAVAAILAAGGDDFATMAFIAAVAVALLGFVFLGVLNIVQRNHAVAMRVIDYRLESGHALQCPTTVSV